MGKTAMIHDHYDVIIVGDALPGWMTACQLQSQGAKCLLLTHPGPFRNQIDNFDVPIHQNDLFDLWSNQLKIPIRKFFNTAEGDPAFTYCSEQSNLVFATSGNPHEVLLASHAFLPRNFNAQFSLFYDAYQKDTAYQHHTLWPNLNDSDFVNRASEKLLFKYVSQLIKQAHTYKCPHDWEWDSFLSAILPMLTLADYETKHLYLQRLYKCIYPKSHHLSSPDFRAELSKHFIQQGGTILSHVPMSNLFIHHQSVKGVVLAPPSGAIWGKTILLNSTYENLIQIISPDNHISLNLKPSKFKNVPFHFQSSRLHNTAVPHTSKTWMTFPLICNESLSPEIYPNSTSYVFKNRRSEVRAHPATQSQHVLIHKTSFSISPAPHKQNPDYAPTLSLPISMSTKFKNVFYGNTWSTECLPLTGAVIQSKISSKVIQSQLIKTKTFNITPHNSSIPLSHS
jgi:hypothetical protein